MAGGTLRKIPVGGGPALTVCRLPGGSTYFSGTWSPDGGSIVFSCLLPTKLFEAPAGGSDSRVLLEPDDSGARQFYVALHFLPPETGARMLLFFIGENPEEGDLVVQDLVTGRREALGVTGGFFAYAPSGHILYQLGGARGGLLMALPFSLRTLKPSGDAFAVAENGGWAGVAGDGTLVYREESTELRLVWRNRSGEKLGEIGCRGVRFLNPTLSPDGRFLAVGEQSEGFEDLDVWVHDLTRSISNRITQHPGYDFSPVWSPAGDRIVFSSTRKGGLDLFVRSADGSGEPEPLVVTPDHKDAFDWSKDGRHLLFTEVNAETSSDVWRLEFEEDGRASEPVPVMQTRFSESTGALSPDGRCLAYASNRTGDFEVYVRPFPEGGREQIVSRNGGRNPRWRGDGKELYYVEGNTLVAVEATTSPSCSAGAATPLFSDAGLLDNDGFRPYDVTEDGQRFVVVTPAEGAGESRPVIRVVQNWFEEFRDREQD